MGIPLTALVVLVLLALIAVACMVTLLARDHQHGRRGLVTTERPARAHFSVALDCLRPTTCSGTAETRRLSNYAYRITAYRPLSVAELNLVSRV